MQTKQTFSRAELVGFILFILVWWAGTSFALIGMVILPGAKYLNAKATYSVTKATILSSAISYDTGSDGGQTFSPAIEYSYKVNGKEYTSDRFDYSVVGRNRLAPVKAIVARYPSGQEVRAYFNPKNPQQSVLSMTLPHRILSVSCLMLPFVLVGVALLVAIFRNSKRPTRLSAQPG